MKKILSIIVMILALVSSSESSTRGDVQIIQSAENIRFLSQKISKDYLYLYQNPEKTTLKQEIETSMNELDKEIYNIAINTQSSESKDILNFLTYTNQEIKELLQKEVSKDKSILILDYSETFVEASNSIEYLHQYDFSTEEKLLMSLKELNYLLERINKYYIASSLELNKMSNANQIKNSIVQIEAILYAINNYNYPSELVEERNKINGYWKTYKEFLYKSDDFTVPNLLETFVETFKKSMKSIALYHKKRQ